MMNDFQERNMSGLIIKGFIIERAKRFIGENNSEIVTYRITDGTNTYYINHWNPNIYYDIGSEVCLPIIIRPYIRNEKAYVCYTVKQEKLFGEGF